MAVATSRSAPLRAAGPVLWLLAPLCLGAAVCAAGYGEARWWRLPLLLRDAAAGLTLAANTAGLLILCAAASPSRQACYRVAVVIPASLAIVIMISGRAAPGAWVPAHGVLAVVAAAVLAARSFAGRVWRHPLDAAGVTVTGVFVMLAGALMLGPALPPVPAWVIDGALRVNPVIAVTAAAGVDLLHSELFYRLAPVAHWQFEYPGTAASLLVFGSLAIVMTVFSRVGRPGPPTWRRILRPEEHRP